MCILNKILNKCIRYKNQNGIIFKWGYLCSSKIYYAIEMYVYFEYLWICVINVTKILKLCKRYSPNPVIFCPLLRLLPVQPFSHLAFLASAASTAISRYIFCFDCICYLYKRVYILNCSFKFFYKTVYLLFFPINV